MRRAAVGLTVDSACAITPWTRVDLIREALIATIIDSEVVADRYESALHADIHAEIHVTAAVDA
jgi:hypothetical protein